ncbi:hypothetical protein ACFPPD_05535 [Cohnella suwonensis]|uniref:RCK C-terminal domain-containing protein n=1 Tax=Cohnella suwonensis TaxID=696072 RepID=A0ABW0LSC9_9BACL
MGWGNSFGLRDVPNQRYPRKLIAPPSEHLVILEREGKLLVAVGDEFIQGQVEETFKDLA